MNCQQTEQWLSASLDGELDPRHAGSLRAHLQSCVNCREAEQLWQDVGRHLRTTEVVGAQAPEAAWQDVQRVLRLERGKPARTPLFFPGVWKWAAAVAAVLLLAAGLYLGRPPGTDPTAMAAAPVGVEYVETDLPGASSMVYVDDDSGMTVVWVIEADSETDNGAG